MRRFVPNGVRGGLFGCLWLVAALTLLTSCTQTPAPRAEYGDDQNAAWLADGYADDANFDSRWPMRIDSIHGWLTIYQPQLTKLEGDKLWARAAVSLKEPSRAEAVFGAIWMESRITTDRVARTAEIRDVVVTEVRFPEKEGVRADTITLAIRRESITRGPMTLSLDQLVAMLDVVKKETDAASNLRNEPPKILFRTHPAVLVQYDGAPKMAAVEGASGLMRVVNTPFFVVFDANGRTFYLKGGGRWFSATDAMGPFQTAASVPPAVKSVADSAGYRDPEHAFTDAETASLEVITATEPTEVIWTDGPELMSLIPNTDMLYVSNTDSDLFLHVENQQLFVLLSGRWFASFSREGPWTYVPPDKLPDDFAKIPPGSAKSDVLAHVAGTQAAREAVSDTYVPQTAAIDRRNFQQPAIDYDGDPQF